MNFGRSKSVISDLDLKTILKFASKNMLIVGLSGASGSGKTTLVDQITENIPSGSVQVLSQDSYYKDTSSLTLQERKTINFDHPNAIDFELLAVHIRALQQGKTIRQPVYCFVQHNRTGDTTAILPPKILVVEGILILSVLEIRKLLDLSIFIDTDPDTCLIRRLKRDTVQRGRSLHEVIDRYQATTQPMHQEFVAPSKKFADIIIPNTNWNNRAVQFLKKMLRQYSGERFVN